MTPSVIWIRIYESPSKIQTHDESIRQAKKEARAVSTRFPLVWGLVRNAICMCTWVPKGGKPNHAIAPETLGGARANEKPNKNQKSGQMLALHAIRPQLCPAQSAIERLNVRLDYEHNGGWIYRTMFCLLYMRTPWRWRTIA